MNLCRLTTEHERVMKLMHCSDLFEISDVNVEISDANVKQKNNSGIASYNLLTYRGVLQKYSMC